MIVQGRVIGVISIQSLEQEHAFDQGHVELLFTVASQAAVAIENARLYESLTTAYKELRRAREREILAMLGEVAAGLIHKMSNTIGPIPSLAERVRNAVGQMDVATETKLRRISEGAADALSYAAGMSQVLQLGKISTEPADVRILLDDAVRQAIPDPTGQKIHITKDYAPDLSMAYVNAPLVIEVFHNIIRNAVEAMPSGGLLRVSLQKVDDNGIQVLITDTGCGIPEDKKAKIFAVGVSSKKEGKGIGLWFSKKVIEQHQGTIAFDSQEHAGTTFTIFLPLGSPSLGTDATGQEVSHE